MPDQTTAIRRPLRPPRLANLVADRLREQILSGELADGDLLPKQDDLFATFGVSMPSIREALRILETEGLITVRRGNVGGAVVRAPRPSGVAYMIGLVLQSRGVGVDDVAHALRQFEPVCASLASQRPDRARAVVPLLRNRLASSEAVLDDASEYVREARAFHEDLVAACGSETIILIVGALETLWSAHVDQLARRPVKLGPFDERSVRERSLSDHRALVEAIAAGDGDRAEELARSHLAEPERHEFVAARAPVRAALLADG